MFKDADKHDNIEGGVSTTYGEQRRSCTRDHGSEPNYEDWLVPELCEVLKQRQWPSPPQNKKIAAMAKVVMQQLYVDTYKDTSAMGITTQPRREKIIFIGF